MRVKHNEGEEKFARSDAQGMPLTDRKDGDPQGRIRCLGVRPIAAYRTLQLKTALLSERLSQSSPRPVSPQSMRCRRDQEAEMKRGSWMDGEVAATSCGH